MKREIKFRGQTVDTKEWVCGYYRENSFYSKLGEKPVLIYNKHFIGSFSNLDVFDGLFEQVEVIPETVGQFTGLKDKNGVDIYDGDDLKIALYDNEWKTTVRDCFGTLVIDVEGFEYNTTALSFLDDEAEIEVLTKN